MDFTLLPDLAAARVGGRALFANDEFFAAKGNLLKPGRGVFIPDKYTTRGKWMDGWETRRRREPGHDWCVIQLGLRGRIRGFDIDTNHFIGNYPEHASVDACDLPSVATKPALLKAAWVEVLPMSPLSPGSPNQFAARHPRPFTHVRLNIFPDGGVARFRVHGEVEVDFRHRRGRLDLAAIWNGGVVLAVSDEHFGLKTNMIMPGRAPNMGDGWETRRRRGPGHDWAILKLGAPGVLEEIEVDTNHFKGNYPESCSLEGCLAETATLEALAGEALSWTEVLPRTKLRPSRRHHFRKELRGRGPFSHLRLRIYPDGGVSRVRIHGRPVAP